jgi:hypothetical protein
VHPYDHAVPKMKTQTTYLAIGYSLISGWRKDHDTSNEKVSRTSQTIQNIRQFLRESSDRGVGHQR